ncbi:MAG: hypothetical protein RL180_467, partial [Pseudomonadota bacterium]
MSENQQVALSQAIAALDVDAVKA